MDGVETVIAERPMGVFSRQLFLGDTLETDNLDASYDNGVLTLRIPISERAAGPAGAVRAPHRAR